MRLVNSEAGSCNDISITCDHDDNYNDVIDVKVEEDSHVDMDENPVPITFKSIKSENEVSFFVSNVT
jgi:hypothetical protein